MALPFSSTSPCGTSAKTHARFFTAEGLPYSLQCSERLHTFLQKHPNECITIPKLDHLYSH